ncbi:MULTISPECIES: flagellin [Pseudoalteromonas]|uniref:flagellin N-terminal helical domain-containing protein n=1 Tax=Pseudoalteromonas TaxID=53246 RepID=UPI00026C9EB5|nr:MULTISPECIES: flagellin [Pseudoalteromonas]ATC98050.1 flagellin [Pseudoalteromonas spongiae UST010723-006]MCF6457029.1 flagellin FliC [Pseudoalteromonas sp. MMG024]MCF6457032.1 flagellin FliC [Pseudoalteromonas sp. MMG024]
MALYVNSNVTSLNAQRQLSNSTNALSTSFQRLSSGLRVNSAADDAAGLQIGTRLQSQVNGANQGARNANDGISLSQTAEGALEETSNMLQRMRVLAIQSANGSNTASDRAALQKEFSELSSEIDRVASDTTFGGVNILDGTFTADFQVGPDANQVINVAIATSMGATGLAVNDDTIATASQAQTAITAIDDALSTVNGIRADLGAKQNRFSSTIRNLNNISENVSASKSRILDTDFAAESASLARNQVLQQASSSMLAQANQQPQIALSLIG